MTRLTRFYVCATALLLACALAPAFAAEAATRFVATTGSNAGPNTCLASGSPCKTITHALTQAVASDTILVAAGTYNTALGETFPLVIAVNLTLTGAGAPGTIIDAGGTNRVIQIDNPAIVTISGVTITGGNSANGVGSGLFNNGTLTLTGSTVSGNTASCAATTFSCFAEGGGLSNNGTLILTGSTVSGNTASCTSSSSCIAWGGGLFNSGPLTLTNSTVSGNTASCLASGSGNGCRAQGGGLRNQSNTPTVTNSTVTANTASCTTSAGASCSADGGGISHDDEGAPPSLTATIVAKQLAGGDCDTGMASNGFNLDSDGSCGLSGTGDQSGVDPLLGPLQNNGGPTETHALLTLSPAIDAVTSGCPPPATDQRGVTRPQDAACDIGAYEVQTEIAPIPAGIPTLSEWAQIGMAALLLGGGLLAIRKRSVA